MRRTTSRFPPARCRKSGDCIQPREVSQLGRAAALRRRLAWLPTITQVTVALIAVGLGWRVLRYALGFPIWGDEAFVAVNFILRDFRGMIDPLIYGQIVPLGFMWADLAIARVLGVSEWTLRLVPTLAGIAALLLFARFARGLLPRRAALLALGIFAVSFYVVRHGAEVKPYSTDLFVALLLTMLGWAVVQQPHAAGRWIALIVIAGVSVWCSYPAVFVGGAVGLVLTWQLIRARFRPAALVGWLGFGVVFCGSFLAMYYTYARPHAEYAARLKEIPMWTAAFPPLGQPWQLLKWLVGIHTGELFAYPHGGKPPGSIVTLVLVVIGSVRLARTQGLLLLLLLGPLPLTFVAAALHAYPYGGSARTSLYMAPAFCLLAGLGLFIVLRRFLRARQFRTGLLFSAAALAAFALGAMVSDVLRPYDSLATYRSRAAVRTLVTRTAPGDRWVVFNADRRVSYAPYLGDWRGVGAQFVFDALRYAPVPLVWAPLPETLARGPGQRVWLLAYKCNSEKKEVVFPDEQFAVYLATATQRLGPSRYESFSVKQERGKVESVEAYEFGP